MNATPTELEAIQLRWRMKNPQAPTDSHPSAEESEELLAEIRARAEAIEKNALHALKRATGNPASLSHNSKHVLLLYYILFAAIVICGLVALGQKLLGG